MTIRSLEDNIARTATLPRLRTMPFALFGSVALGLSAFGIYVSLAFTVSQRTREIGVRMAVGAKPSYILAQFLVEALTLSLAGGLIGVVIGVGVARWLASRFHWPMLIQPDVILVSVAFSAFVGVVFGLYPAQKASRLDPIDALRFE